LDATGHVDHIAYQKKSVTFHHNAARLSLQGVLDVWTTREASAHFDVDGNGSLGQYVRVNEYAWAVGNTIGNQETISIEMCNLTLSPDWTVAEVTWREAARVCGFLHAKVIGVRPTRTTVKVHKDWKATVCAGPYIDTVLNAMITDAQTSYDFFMATPVVEPPPPPPPDPEPEPPPPPPPDPVYEVKLVPRPDDPAPPTPWVAPTPQIWVPTPGLPITEVAEQVLDGKWGGRINLDAKLRAVGYDYDAVRTEILRLLHKSGDIRMVKRPAQRR
jgi:hypothetical protein